MLRLFHPLLVGLTTLLMAQTAAAADLPPTDTNFETAHFSGSGVCAACHNDLRDANGQDVSLERDWAITMMANSARDPLWQAKVASERRRNPQLDAKIGDTCTRCHAPMAHVTATADGSGYAYLDGGTPDPTHPGFDLAMEGVSCTLCHQIQDNGLLGTPEGASGAYAIDLSQRLAYGPKASPSINPMRNWTGFTPLHGAHMSESTLCGTCHDLHTPTVDADGNIVERAGHGFPEQMVYSEWEHSAYAKGRPKERSCQDCHMPETDGVKLANRPRWLSPEDDFSRHSFLGANTVMLDLIDRHSEELGATEADFGPAIQAARENLAGAAELRVWRAAIEGDRLLVSLGVRNLSGHKLPSGYPSRRVYLHLLVRDEAGNLVFESGRMRADGSIVGVDSDWNESGFEPHRRRITNSRQVQVYESIMGDTDGAVTYTLLEASQYLKDNRLLPAGFDKATAPADIAVIGAAAADKNFAGGWDGIAYEVTVPANGQKFTVEAELIYQPLAYGYLRDLFKDQDDPAVARFMRMYEASPLRAETIAATRLMVSR